MYTGIFSPNEAASVGAVGALIFAIAGRTMGRDRFKASLIETASTSGMIFLIIIGAGLFNFFLEGTNVPQFLIQQVQRLDLGPPMFLEHGRAPCRDKVCQYV